MANIAIGPNIMFSSMIKKWFEDEWGGGLILPDGWFGRPYDNQHTLTSIQESPSELRLELDKNLSLRFENLKEVRVVEDGLEIGPFARLRFQWTPYGGGDPISTAYEAGMVRIVSAPGS